MEFCRSFCAVGPGWMAALACSLLRKGTLAESQSLTTRLPVKETERSLKHITHGRAPIRGAKQLIGHVAAKKVEPIGPGMKPLMIAHPDVYKRQRWSHLAQILTIDVEEPSPVFRVDADHRLSWFELPSILLTRNYMQPRRRAE